MYTAPMHPYTLSPDVAVVLAVVTVVVGVVVATVPAMGRGNAEHNVFFQYLKTANCENCSLPSHTHTHIERGGGLRGGRESHITPNTPFIDVALGAVMAAERENDTNTHREGGRERHTKHRERER